MNDTDVHQEVVKLPATTPDPQWLAKDPLRPSTILVAEFQYIAQSAFQAHEDRARATTYYLAAVGSLVTGFVGSQFETLRQPAVCWGFAILFIVLSIVGLLTLLQLARLRTAWFEAIEAMNSIKEFYTEALGEVLDLGDAFEWTNDTAPPRVKPSSLSFLLALQVALLAGMTLGAAVIFAGLGYGRWWGGYAIFLGLAFTVSQLILYSYRVRSD